MKRNIKKILIDNGYVETNKNVFRKQYGLDRECVIVVKRNKIVSSLMTTEPTIDKKQIDELIDTINLDFQNLD